MTGKLYKQFSSKVCCLIISFSSMSMLTRLKFTYMLFLCLFELGSLLCGVATSSKMLIVGRAVAGMGGAGLMNGGLTIIAACVPLEKRASMIKFKSTSRNYC